MSRKVGGFSVYQRGRRCTAPNPFGARVLRYTPTSAEIRRQAHKQDALQTLRASGPEYKIGPKAGLPYRTTVCSPKRLRGKFVTLRKWKKTEVARPTYYTLFRRINKSLADKTLSAKQQSKDWARFKAEMGNARPTKRNVYEALGYSD